MTINDNKVVSLIYKLEVAGEIQDQTTKENPLEFIFGLGYLLPKFEENIKDKAVGDTFDFELAARDGYGDIDPQAVVDLPMNIFEIDGKIQEGLLTVGNVINMMNQMGGVIPGKVVEVGKESVKMDFNHQMAGKDLHFTGEIIAIREATEEELTNGLHGERAPHNCGGECSSCGGGCH
ncbi:MAG: FKBP-type peptidyl-prolyl cis-trans isomerase [Bacteroidales bacterium]|nr:FKBP-type peptidyl-prolyl cis-trans isomerase [Bacteroidales bacterium]MDD4670137.1 FKBP-type peptidyl-prolyl cis-trans isomerase [Bacteroidales bacterium]